MMKYKFIVLFFFLFSLSGYSKLFAQNLSKQEVSQLFIEAEDLLALGKYNDAISFYEKTLSYDIHAADKNRILSELGYVYATLGNEEKSLVYFKKALNQALEGTPDSTVFIADQYYYIAYNYHQLEDFNKALEFYQTSLSLAGKDIDPIGFGETLYSVSSIYLYKSDYDNAILFAQQALNIFEKEKDDILIAEGNDVLGLNYYYKQDYEQALSYAESAVSFYEETKDESFSVEKISVYNNYALILMQLNKLGVAEKYLNKSRDLCVKGNQEESLVITSFNQAFLYYEKSDYGLALQFFQESIRLHQKKFPNGNSNIGKAYYYIGNIHAIQNKNKEALQFYQKSIQSLVPDFINKEVNGNPSLNDYCRSKRNLLKTLIAKAKVLGELCNEKNKEELIPKVLETYDLAIKTAEELRQSYKSEGSRYFLAEETKELFEGAVAFSYGLYQKTKNQTYFDKAFFYIEKNQTPILLQNHLAIESVSVGGVPKELIKQEKELAIDLAFYKNQEALAKSKKDSIKIDLYADYVYENKSQLDSLRAIFQKDYPSYFNYKLNAENISIVEVQESLSSNEIFIQYYLTGNNIYAINITNNHSEIRLIENANEIKIDKDAFIGSVLNPLTNKMSEDDAYSEIVGKGYSLYSKLLEPILNNNESEINRIIIANNDFITEIPFEILISKPIGKNTIDYLSLNYLIRDYTISYQPSASLMVRLNNQTINRESGRELLAVAPFANEKLLNNNRKSILDNLPYTKKELENIEQLFKTDAYYEQEASKQFFLDEAGKYKILHLATHGEADYNNAANTRLFFYPENPNKPESHILYNYEVQNLQLNADLVVLSACETGAGRIDTGEGILSLARGFFYTGVPSVIMSKWQINDQSSSIIINDLYKNLKLGEKKDQALQKAKINYLESEADLVTAHPFYWAGLVQIGNSNELNFKNNSKWWLYLILAVLFMIPVGILYSKRDKGFNAN